MTRFILRRLGLGAVTLGGAMVLVFLLTHYLPGNPALVKAGQYGDPKAVAAIEHEMGLDKPLPVQFATYVTNLVHLDLGTSYNTGQSVVTDLRSRIPATFELALWSSLIAVLVAIPLGILAGLKAGSMLDFVARTFAVLGTSLPLFWLGLLVVYIFYAKLQIAPAPDGRLSSFTSPPTSITGLYVIDSLLTGNFPTLLDAVGHLAMPAMTLALVEIAPILKVVRSATIEVMRTDYVRTARAIGLSEWQIVRQDLLRNVGVQLFTMVGIVLGYLLSGSVLVERIFNWPGIGLYAWNAMLSNDLAAIQGFVLLVAAIYICLNLAIDVLYAFVDPRIRYA
ncbi:MAG: ABC transporter permease [Candidatus Dormibacteria bacterium]